MTKWFCDVCGEELDEDTVSNRVKVERTFRDKLPSVKVEAEVMVAVDGVWNKGNICRLCLYRTLDQGDPRPRPVTVVEAV